MDTSFNYLIGKSEKLPKDYNYVYRPDPDTDGCKRLYDDIILIYFKEFGKVENKEQSFKYRDDKKSPSLKELWQKYELLNNDKPKRKSDLDKPPFYTIIYKDYYLLSSDYIGPSIYWAEKSGLEKSEIIEILDICRTIGGHIVWPRGKKRQLPTINQARGGKKSFYDRIDWTLFLVKFSYANNFDKETIIKKLDLEFDFDTDTVKRCEALVEVIIEDKNWFLEFETFEKFCKQFLLVNSFVNGNYEINWLAPRVPILPDDYRNFSNKNCGAIQLRNKIIKENP